MKSVGVFEAKTHLSEILERVANGESITITKRGDAIAQIIPFSGSKIAEKSSKEILAGIRSLREQVKTRFPKVDQLSVREMKEAGRR